jgi:hypothetical protein
MKALAHQHVRCFVLPGSAKGPMAHLEASASTSSALTTRSFTPTRPCGIGGTAVKQGDVPAGDFQLLQAGVAVYSVVAVLLLSTVNSARRITSTSLQADTRLNILHLEGSRFELIVRQCCC